MRCQTGMETLRLHVMATLERTAEAAKTWHQSVLLPSSRVYGAAITAGLRASGNSGTEPWGPVAEACTADDGSSARFP